MKISTGLNFIVLCILVINCFGLNIKSDIIPNGAYSADITAGKLKNFKVIVKFDGTRVSFKDCNNVSCPYNYRNPMGLGDCISTKMFC
jgi:hypothetical protein